MSKTEKQVISGYHRPVCPECKCEMRPEKNGVKVVDMASFGPAEIYDADLWKCPRCKKEVIGGFGNGPMHQHWEDNFQERLAMYRESGELFENYG